MTTNNATTIAFVSGYALHIGGAETYILSLLKCADRKRYHFVVTGPTSVEFARQCETYGATVVPLSQAHLLDISMVQKLYRIFRQHQVDIVHAQDPRGGLWARIAAKLARLPAVYTVHTYVGDYFTTNDIWVRLKRRAYLSAEGILARKFTNRVIFVSATTYKKAVAQGVAIASNSVIIPNGINLERYQVGQIEAKRVRQEFGASQGEVIVCFVGRFTPQKGLDFLIEAGAKLLEDFPNTRFWLVGDGPLRDSIEEKIRTLNLEHHFTLPGFCSNVPAILAACDIFVLPSRYENFPMTLLEAMAAGKPCVVSNVGDNALLVRDGEAGFVVPSGDVSLLADRLGTLIADPQLRSQMGSQARQKSAKYSEGSMVRSVIKVYDGLYKHE